MVKTGAAFPDFADPPVTETVLSVEFSPIENWSILSFGLFWAAIQTEYPNYQIVPPLGSAVERFGEEAKEPLTLNVEFSMRPEVRCWFLNEAGTRLIQVQNGRFVSNWRKVLGDEEYPRYSSTRAMFEREWTRFCGFLESQALPQPAVKQCEVSYFNHIERGKGWGDFGDLKEVIPSWSGECSGTFLPTPEAVLLTTRYVMPGDQGRLHVLLQPVIRLADRREVLQLELTARGRPASSDLGAVLAWLDLGREWVVKGFADFTSSKMHQLWERRP